MGIANPQGVKDAASLADQLIEELSYSDDQYVQDESPVVRDDGSAEIALVICEVTYILSVRRA